MGYKRTIAHMIDAPGSPTVSTPPNASSVKRLRPTPPHSPSQGHTTTIATSTAADLDMSTPHSHSHSHAHVAMHMHLQTPTPLHSSHMSMPSLACTLDSPQIMPPHHASTPIPNPCLSTPRRPPRMPRFERSSAGSEIVQRLNSLSPHDLIALVKDVEARYRQLSAFEAEEIRRAQRLGFSLTCTSRHTPRHLQTACLSA